MRVAGFALAVAAAERRPTALFAAPSFAAPASPEPSLEQRAALAAASALGTTKLCGAGKRQGCGAARGAARGANDSVGVS